MTHRLLWPRDRVLAFMATFLSYGGASLEFEMCLYELMTCAALGAKQGDG